LSIVPALQELIHISVNHFDQANNGIISLIIGISNFKNTLHAERGITIIGRKLQYQYCFKSRWCPISELYFTMDCSLTFAWLFIDLRRLKTQTICLS